MAITIAGGTDASGGTPVSAAAATLTEASIFTTPNTANARFIVDIWMWTSFPADIEFLSDGKVVELPYAKHHNASFKLHHERRIVGPNIAVKAYIMNTHASSARNVNWRYQYVSEVFS